MIKRCKPKITNCCNNKEEIKNCNCAYKIVKSKEELYSIPCSERVNGMVVTIINEGYKYYSLQSLNNNLCSNENWIEIVFNGTNNNDNTPNLQQVTDEGYVTTNPINVQNIIFARYLEKGQVFYTDKEYIANSYKGFNNNVIINGPNNASLFFQDNDFVRPLYNAYISGQNNLNLARGVEGVYNNALHISGINLGNTNNFIGAENTALIGYSVFEGELNNRGFKERTIDYTYTREDKSVPLNLLAVGVGIMNRYNERMEVELETSNSLRNGVILGNMLYMNGFKNSILLSYDSMFNDIEDSIFIGNSKMSGFLKGDKTSVKSEDTFKKDIVITNSYNNDYKRNNPHFRESMLYIGNDEPLLIGKLNDDSTSGRFLEINGNLKIKSSIASNHVTSQNELLYNKYLVADNEGNIKLQDKPYQGNIYDNNTLYIDKSKVTFNDSNKSLTINLTSSLRNYLHIKILYSFSDNMNMERKDIFYNPDIVEHYSGPDKVLSSPTYSQIIDTITLYFSEQVYNILKNAITAISTSVNIENILKIKYD